MKNEHIEQLDKESLEDLEKLYKKAMRINI